MELTLTEIKPILKYIINNNKQLQEKGEFPVAVNLCGDAGLGKTSIIEQLAEELGVTYIKINLSQLTDPAELCGWPIKEHYICKPDGDCKWVTGEVLDAYAKSGWEVTDETRMGYAVPAWLKNADANKGVILCLDDYSRATPALLQACMEITCRQEYISWKLPFGSTVILTTNPDNSSYNVSGMDEAQATRFITFDVKFDANSWAKYAEDREIDGRGIAFLLAYHSELMDRSKTKCARVNARNYTMFINTISGIKDWSAPSSLATILQIASGCFVDDNDIVGGLFTQFIANKLDKLIAPEDLLLKDWTYVKTALTSQVYDKDLYRADIASIVTTRFVNYSLKYFNTKGAKTDKVVDRILDIIDNDKILLTEDLIFSLINTLNKMSPTRCNKLFLNPKIAKKLM